MDEGEHSKKISKLQKMTRSFSFKFPGTDHQKPQSNGAAPAKPPRKLNPDNWLKGKQFTGTRHVKETPPNNIRMFNSVGDKMSMWTKKVDSHKEKQALNPFSESFDKDKLRTQLANKDDPNYGRPDSGSLSAMRAAMGEAKMRSDICDVCDVVFQQGEKLEDGLAAIQFGPLFSIYDRINDKLVGLLIRARKRNLLTFEGEMLYQRKDDEKWIELTKNINTIHCYFGRDTRFEDGGDVDPEIEKDQVFGLRSRLGSLESEKPSPAPSVDSFPSRCSASPHTIEKTRSNMSLLTVEAGKTSKGSKAKSLKNSFRKLVKPLVKKRETGKEAATDTETDSKASSTKLSRRDSKVSSVNISRSSVASEAGKPGVNISRSSVASEAGKPGARKTAEARWGRAIRASLFISRIIGINRKKKDEEA